MEANTLNINAPRSSSPSIKNEDIEKLRKSLQERIKVVRKLKITGILEDEILKAVNEDSSVDSAFKNRESLDALLDSLA